MQVSENECLYKSLENSMVILTADGLLNKWVSLLLLPCSQLDTKKKKEKEKKSLSQFPVLRPY